MYPDNLYEKVSSSSIIAIYLEKKFKKKIDQAGDEPS